MRLPFFSSIQWEDIYYRVKDGPWLPEPVSFRTQSFSVHNSAHGPDASTKPAIASSIRHGITPAADEYRGFNSIAPGSSVPEKRIAGSVPRGNANGVGASEGAAAGQEQEGNDIKPKKKSSKKGKGAAKAAKKQQTAEEELERDVLAAGQMDEELARDMQNVSIDDVNVTAGDEEEEGDDQDDEEDGEEDMEGEVPQDEATRPVDPDSDNDIPEEPEIVPQRDSIFISGRNKSTPNVVADWSFVDVDALAAAALDGPPASNAPSNNSNCTTTSKTPFSNK
jgi:hypothetical protein